MLLFKKWLDEAKISVPTLKPSRSALTSPRPRTIRPLSILPARKMPPPNWTVLKPPKRVRPPLPPTLASPDTTPTKSSAPIPATDSFPAAPPTLKKRQRNPFVDSLRDELSEKIEGPSQVQCEGGHL